MHKKIFFYFSLFIIASCSQKQSSVSDIDKKVATLISQMTIEEKVGQMTQLNLGVVCKGEIYKLIEPIQLDEAKLKKAIVDYKVGSIFNCGGHTLTPEHWNELINKMQQLATTETQLKIPLIYGVDAIHGANYTIGATLFPQELAQAATWNSELTEQIASATAYETRASGIPWNFSPVLDLGRQPLWSRFFETYGEDVYLAKTMAGAAIKGYQGNDVAAKEKVAACMKHFLGYSFSLSGKDRTPAWIPERELREYFLPTFQEAINQGAKTVMINSGEINGIPVHADKNILTTLLRDELKFKGVAVTDWEDIIKLYNVHHVASSLKEAVKLAINAGIDMSMVPNDFQFSDLLLELVKEKQVSETRIDEAVKRILTLKYELGLFEHPTTELKDYPDFGSQKFQQLSYDAAVESITLLKNEKNNLPLSKDKKILICGPAANSLNILNGAWTHTWQGVDTTYNTKNKKTILQAMIEKVGKNNIKFVEGASLNKEININQAVDAAKNVDYIVACIGEIPCTEKPGDIESLTLPEAQLNLIHELAKTGKPIVLVLVENRPRLINAITDKVQSIVMAYLPSNEGGRAIVDILFGEKNPSGKLPFTYPRYSGDIVHYDHKYSEKLDKNYGTNAFNPQFEFGFGMSYTSFEYSNLTISSDSINTNDTLTLSVNVKNSGSRIGKEVVELFISDLYASITPSVKKLKRFKKIELEAGKEQKIEFKISSSDLTFIGQENKAIAEPGEFEINIANLKNKFILKK